MKGKKPAADSSSEAQQSSSPSADAVQSSAPARIQDPELQQMGDERFCLSVHQPFASLLVRGIKKYVCRIYQVLGSFHLQYSS